MAIELNNEDVLIRQISKWLQTRVEDMAKEEIDAARERLAAKIPQLAAEIGIQIQQALSRDPMNMNACLQILIKPTLQTRIR